MSSASNLLGTKYTERANASRREQLGVITQKHGQDQGEKLGRWSVLSDKVVQKRCLNLSS